jgi:hypothetical protein
VKRRGVRYKGSQERSRGIPGGSSANCTNYRDQHQRWWWLRKKRDGDSIPSLFQSRVYTFTIFRQLWAQEWQIRLVLEKCHEDDKRKPLCNHFVSLKSRKSRDQRL